MQLEHSLLQRESLDQFSVYWYESSQEYKAWGDATSSSDRRYHLAMPIPSGFPRQRPPLYLTDPSPLWTADYRTVASLGVSHDMHTLTPSESGSVQICHWRDDRWHARIFLYQVFLKGLLWIEAYEQHLATGRPLAEFVSTMAGRT
jgi:hypothetical protein